MFWSQRPSRGSGSAPGAKHWVALVFTHITCQSDSSGEGEKKDRQTDRQSGMRCFFSFCETGQELLTTSRLDWRISPSAGPHLVFSERGGNPAATRSGPRRLSVLFFIAGFTGFRSGATLRVKHLQSFYPVFLFRFVFVLFNRSSASPDCSVWRRRNKSNRPLWHFVTLPPIPWWRGSQWKMFGIFAANPLPYPPLHPTTTSSLSSSSVHMVPVRDLCVGGPLPTDPKGSDVNCCVCVQSKVCGRGVPVSCHSNNEATPPAPPHPTCHLLHRQPPPPRFSSDDPTAFST